MNEKYADICGYTDAEIDHYLHPYIHAWADKDTISYAEQRQKIRTWYNGYRFTGNELSVYNPFSILHAIDEKKYNNFWYATGTPSFLIEQLRQPARNAEISELFEALIDSHQLEVTESMLGTFDVDGIPLEALLFQTGYLSLAGYNAERHVYALAYPNIEVERSLKECLVEFFSRLEHHHVGRLLPQLPPEALTS